MKINFLPINKFQDAKNKLYVISKESIQAFDDEERAAMVDQSFDGKSGENCGDCGVAYSACCVGYAADGYPCDCNVE